MLSADFGIETLRCRMLRSRRLRQSMETGTSTTSDSAFLELMDMLKLHAALLAYSLSKRCRRVLRLSGRRWIKLFTLSGLLPISSIAFAFASIDTSNMTCAQVQDYVKTHGQTLLTTGSESGNYSFNYDDCGGTVPGFACTTDEAYCYVGWWCDYNYPVAVNPNVHDHGTNFCPARRR